MKSLMQMNEGCALSALVKIEALTAKQKRVDRPGSRTQHCNGDSKGKQ